MPDPPHSSVSVCLGAPLLVEWQSKLAACSHVTFDIFDTILGRDVFEPHDVHLEVSRRLEAAGIKSGLSYKRRRIEAESSAAREKGAAANIEKIYRLLSNAMRWSDEQAKVAGQIELNVERECSLPLESGLILLQEARNAGKFLGFVSDMYLPSEFVRELLEQIGAWHEGDQLWISCECGASKSDGTLFSYINKQCSVPFTEWFHVGDNPKGDSRVPQSLGINSILLPNPKSPARLKRKFPGNMLRRRTAIESSLCGAIERAVRQGKSRNFDERQSAIWDATCTGVAPIICNFALWAFHRAKSQGLQELWCLARDGQIIDRLAKIFLPAVKSPLITRYMPASRQAFRLAGVQEIGEFEARWIFGTYGPLEPSVVWQRLGGGDSIRQAMEVVLAAVENSFNEPLDEKGSAVLKKWLLSEDGKTRVLSAAKHQKDLFLRYLEQEKIGNSFGVLDIGWAGSLQDGLRKMFFGTRYEQKLLHGYYFGLMRDKNIKPDSLLEGFLLQPGNVPKLYHKAIQVFEMFFAGDHAQVQGFREKGERRVEVAYLPIESWKSQLDWGVTTQQDAIVALARELAKTRLMDCQESWMDSARILLDDFLLHPTRAEAQAYSTWTVSSLVGLETNELLGPVLDEQNFRFFMKNLSLTSHHWQPIMRLVNDPWIYWKYRLSRFFHNDF